LDLNLQLSDFPQSRKLKAYGQPLKYLYDRLSTKHERLVHSDLEIEVAYAKILHFRRNFISPTNPIMKKLSLFALLIGQCATLFAQNPYNGNSRFEQLGNTLPTPNTYRTASGAPGKDYWQNRADYDIKAELDDQKRITGSKVIPTKTFLQTTFVICGCN
jgi:hypothetical protein